MTKDEQSKHDSVRVRRRRGHFAPVKHDFTRGFSVHVMRSLLDMNNWYIIMLINSHSYRSASEHITALPGLAHL